MSAKKKKEKKEDKSSKYLSTREQLQKDKMEVTKDVFPNQVYVCSD